MKLLLDTHALADGFTVVGNDAAFDAAFDAYGVTRIWCRESGDATTFSPAMKTPILLAAMLAPTLSCAGPRTSANYHAPTESADAGGRRATSTSYTSDGSLGGITGIATVAAPAGTAKSGYLGQLTDVTGLVLNASALTVNETGTLQLAAWQLLDDTSLLAVGANAVTWGVVAGPVTGISGTGLATAGTVPQNTAATVQGAFGGFTGTLNLTVLDTIPDNFGSYAGDGIGDDWQVQYFGANNPNAGPSVDFSHTGQTNLFKYIAGLNPLDVNSRFVTTIVPVPDPAHPGQFLPGQQSVIFSPRFSDRIYTVKFRTDLTTGTWQPLTGTTQGDNGTIRTVTDTGAAGTQKFYRIEITKP